MSIEGDSDFWQRFHKCLLTKDNTIEVMAHMASLRQSAPL